MKNKREIIYIKEKKKGLSPKKLETLLKSWQTKLAMEEWELDVKIVEFRREDGYRQSGDFIADPKKKTATILMTFDPWRGDEEYTLVHEMLHVLLYDYDLYSESLILKKFKENGTEHNNYLDKLEDTTHHLTRILLGRNDR